MLSAVALRDDQVEHRAADRLIAAKPKYALGARVPVADRPMLVKADDGAVGALEDLLGEIRRHLRNYHYLVNRSARAWSTALGRGLTVAPFDE